VSIATENSWPRRLAFGRLGECEFQPGMNGYAANSSMPPPLAVRCDLSKNSPLGFESKNPVWPPGPTAANSTTTIGFRASSLLDAIRQSHRARYYNPLSGRFMSKDPYDGTTILPITLHKYLYAGGSPVNHVDPRGRSLFEYAMESSASVPEAKLIDIYGCVAGAGLAAIDLVLGEINPSDTTGNIGTGLGTGSAILGCVVLVPGLNELAGSGAKVTKAALKFVATASTVSGWGACAADAEDFVNGLNSLLSGNPSADAIAKSLEDLGGCVGSALGAMLKAEAE
jgi:RHS repeat-associated protein